MIKCVLMTFFLSIIFLSMDASINFNTHSKEVATEIYIVENVSNSIIIDSLNSVTLVPKDTTRRKKIISAICAFPFPFGFVGMHRVMLGTKPWVPIVYVATFGGGFGILPLVDFFVIIFKKDIVELENNPNLFMWTK